MRTFLDEARIFVAGGNGGDGAMHFRREKYVPLGGPDGGDGGHGGGVYVRADAGLNTLFPFQRKRRFSAPAGQAGGASRMHGRSGEDLYVDVPVGTVIRDADSGELLGDLVQPGQSLLVARGGKGGLGNVHFKSSTHQAPRFAEKGEPGQQRTLELELKVLADVGLVGLPNAGKSTLLSLISAARPKIADYPFTTLSPELGVVEVEDYTFVAADIPGLIEGAHEGVGLGHEFLRHIERTRVLVHVVDAAAPDPPQGFEQINEELREYAADLAEKPQLVALNKMDLPEAEDALPELNDTLRARGYEVFPISGVTRTGLDRLLYRTVQLLQEQARELAQRAPEEGLPVITPAPHPDYFTVERKRHTYYVRGENAERLVVMTDFDSEEAIYRLQQRLRRMGVFQALQRAGATEGSRVVIGETEFDWDSSYEPQVSPRVEEPAKPRRRR